MDTPEETKQPEPEPEPEKGVTVIRSIEIRGPRLRQVGYARRQQAAESARKRRAEADRLLT